jgi:hypothetical protein
MMAICHSLAGWCLGSIILVRTTDDVDWIFALEIGSSGK